MSKKEKPLRRAFPFIPTVLHITTYPHDGSNIIGKVKYQDGKVYNSDQQYFDHVPEVAWTFYIGRYQPAQK